MGKDRNHLFNANGRIYWPSSFVQREVLLQGWNPYEQSYCGWYIDPQTNNIMTTWVKKKYCQVHFCYRKQTDKNKLGQKIYLHVQVEGEKSVEGYCPKKDSLLHIDVADKWLEKGWLAGGVTDDDCWLEQQQQKQILHFEPKHHVHRQLLLLTFETFLYSELLPVCFFSFFEM